MHESLTHFDVFDYFVSGECPSALRAYDVLQLLDVSPTNGYSAGVAKTALWPKYLFGGFILFTAP